MKIRNIIQMFFAALFLIALSISCKDDNLTYMSISDANKDMFPGDSHQFTISVQGDGSLDVSGVVWSVYKETPLSGLNTTGKVIEIESETGMVKAIDYGTAEVKAQLPDGQYLLGAINVTERPGPNNDEISFLINEYYMNYMIPEGMLTFRVDSVLLDKYPLTFTSSNEDYITVGNSIQKVPNQDGYYTVTISSKQSVRLEEPVRVTAKLGNAEAYCDVYLGTALSKLSLEATDANATGKTLLFPINTDVDTIKVYYEAFPNDETSLKNIDYKLTVTGGTLLVTEQKYNPKVSGEYLIIIKTGGISGEANVTLEALGKSVTATCIVYDYKDHPVESITLPRHNEIVYGQFAEFKLDELVINPFGVSDYWPLTWSSSDESVATVKIERSEQTGDMTAKVTFYKLGSVDIIVNIADKQDVCHFDVKYAIDKIAITESTKNEYYKGEEETWKTRITSTFENDGRAIPVWSSSNPEVASVDQQGKVVMVGEGTATITVEVTDDRGTTHRDSKTITVKSPSDTNIIDIVVTDRFVYGWTASANSTIIEIFNQDDGSGYLTFNINGKIDVAVDKTYTVGTDITGNAVYNYSEDWYGEWQPETAQLLSGTIKTENGTLIFDLVVQKGSVTKTVKGTVLVQY